MNPNTLDVDSFMKIDKINQNHMKCFIPLSDERFTILGLPFYKENNNFERNYNKYKEEIALVNSNINHLATHTAGAMVTFKTNAQKLILKAVLSKPACLWHMAPTCECGFDLYINLDNNLRFYNVTRCEQKNTTIETTLFENFTDEEKEIVIYFPLYSGVEELEIMINEEANIKKYSRFSEKKWLFYGTSITQGGCASRPGMCYTNILSRHYNKEIINLGYSGNGLGENIIAKMINEINNLECVFIDYDANAGALGTIENTLENFIVTLKEKNPLLKVIVISRVKQISQLTDRVVKAKYDKYRIFEKECIEKLSKNYSNLYYINGEDLLDEEFYDECTVDNVHFTDLGFYTFSKNIIPKIDVILKD